MSQILTNVDDTDGTPVAAVPTEADPEEAALMAALRVGNRPAGDCKSDSCDTCPCRFEEGAAHGPGKRT